MSFGLLTLNLWNISEPLDERYGALAAGLKLLRADVICLQEVSRDPRTQRSQAELVAEMAGLPHMIEANGLAIISSFAALRVTRTPLPNFPEDSGRELLAVDLRVEERPVLLANTHLAYLPTMKAERMQQADAILASIDQHKSVGTSTAKILCGDFNDVPESLAIRAVVASRHGFGDAFEACHPGEAGLTYACSKNRYVDPVWNEEQRVDYIFIDTALIAKKCSVVFDGANGLDIVSDHFGLFAELAFT